MSRFPKNLRTGSKVKQGQTIGYVGKTGLASGVHLHYEFRINGKPYNPLKVRLPKASPVLAKDKARFQLSANEMLARLSVA